MASCEHVDQIHKVTPSAEVCKSCLEMGDRWVHLRICLTCGHVGCCDSTEGHATAHARESGHPMIRSLSLGGGSFTYCYEGDGYV